MTSFTLGTFNIRCFGFGGEYDGRKGTEYRSESILKIIKHFFSDCDAILFQEICDLNELEALLDEDWNLFTYPHNYPRHQHIALALRTSYEFKDSFNCQFQIDALKLNAKTSRPGLIGNIYKNGVNSPLLSLVGLHLKSGAYHSDKRQKQINNVKQFMARSGSPIPVLLAGDLNTQSAQHTGQPMDDILLLENSLSEMGLTRVKNQQPTYMTPWESHCLDHIFYTEEALVPSQFSVLEIEGLNNPDPTEIKSIIQSYYEEVSDHLPFKASFNFKN